MKLSDRIGQVADEEIGYASAIIGRRDLYDWQETAQRIEADQRAAWRSFYIASAVVGLLIAFAVWQRFELQPKTAPASVVQSRVMYA